MCVYNMYMSIYKYVCTYFQFLVVFSFPNSLAKKLNLKRFTTNSEVATIIIHSTVENIVKKLLSVSMYRNNYHY